MYKRYYDGYKASPDFSPRGEVITPKCAEEISDRCDKDEKRCRVCDDSKGKGDCCSDRDAEIRCTSPCEDSLPLPSASCCPPGKSRGENIFGDIGLDDIILIAIILIMLKEGTEDSMLIIVLGAIFLFGFID